MVTKEEIDRAIFMTKARKADKLDMTIGQMEAKEKAEKAEKYSNWKAKVKTQTEKSVSSSKAKPQSTRLNRLAATAGVLAERGRYLATQRQTYEKAQNLARDRKRVGEYNALMNKPLPKGKVGGGNKSLFVSVHRAASDKITDKEIYDGLKGSYKLEKGKLGKDVEKRQTYKEYSKEQKLLARQQAKKDFQESKTGKYVANVRKIRENLERKGIQVEKKLYTLARKEIKPRKVLKKGQMSYKLREYQPDNLLMHSNKFFTDNYQQEKRSLFFT